LNLARASWQQAMLETAQTRLGVQWRPFEPDEQVLERALALAREKYSRAKYNQRR
jgi:hypothetical protein